MSYSLSNRAPGPGSRAPRVPANTELEGDESPADFAELMESNGLHGQQFGPQYDRDYKSGGAGEG